MAFIEAFRSLIPTKFIFQDGHGYETLLSETRGGVHATGVVASEDLVEVIRLAHCAAVALSTRCCR